MVSLMPPPLDLSEFDYPDWTPTQISLTSDEMGEVLAIRCASL